MEESPRVGLGFAEVDAKKPRPITMPRDDVVNGDNVEGMAGRGNAGGERPASTIQWEDPSVQ